MTMRIAFASIVLVTLAAPVVRANTPSPAPPVVGRRVGAAAPAPSAGAAQAKPAAPSQTAPARPAPAPAAPPSAASPKPAPSQAPPSATPPQAPAPSHATPSVALAQTSTPAPTPAPAVRTLPPPVAALPPSPPAETYTYHPDGRRDPFLSLIGTGPDKSITSRRGDGPAGMTLGEISVRGIMQSRGALVAMIQGPDNKTYIVHQGEKLLDGTIKTITPQGLVVIQEVNDPLSLVKQREVRKLLRSLEDAKE
jgi:Tfp pilus assembly protein PilP